MLSFEVRKTGGESEVRKVHRDVIHIGASTGNDLVVRARGVLGRHARISVAGEELRLAAMEDVGRRYPSRVSKSALPGVGVFWRFLFVPLFRRVPWSFKVKAMRLFRMTAAGWPADARRFGEPWRPPPPPEG